MARPVPSMVETRTSLKGQSRPNWPLCAMSGFLPVATGSRTSRNGSFVPKPEVAASVAMSNDVS